VSGRPAAGGLQRDPSRRRGPLRKRAEPRSAPGKHARTQDRGALGWVLRKAVQARSFGVSSPSMAGRKQFQSTLTVTPELKRLLEEAHSKDVSEADLQEQRVSFAFGNAPPSDLITKDSVLYASRHTRRKD
jgi:hypothetical protein